MNLNREEQDLLKAFIASTNAIRKLAYRTPAQVELLDRNGELAMKVYKAFFHPKEEKGKLRQITLDEAIANEKQQ